MGEETWLQAASSQYGTARRAKQPVLSMELLDLGGVRPTAYTIDAAHCPRGPLS